MQAASNFLQDKVLGGPLPIDQNAAPEWNEREGESQKALTWQAVDKVELKDMPVPDITEDKDVILRVTGALPRLFLIFLPFASSLLPLGPRYAVGGARDRRRHGGQVIKGK